ncbi:MAG: site-2 protease family protein [Novosphingobium sp.]
MNETLFQAATLIIPLVLAIVFHEVAHGWTARALGDPTAEERGRLTLNPLKHVDPVGTVILPGMLALMKAPILGWAKPVPVNMWRLRKPRSDMMLVAAAGPASNLVLAAIGAVVLGLLARNFSEAQPPEGLSAFLVANLINFLLINTFLAFFNLLPIPPFDGSHIVEGLLPERMAEAYASMRRYGMAVVLVLIVVLPMLAPEANLIARFVLPPVEWMAGQYMALAAFVAGAG